MFLFAELIKEVVTFDAENPSIEQNSGGASRKIIDEEDTRHADDICGICGRTLLAGEKAEVYEDYEDLESFVVCPMCRPSARVHGYRQIA